MCINRKISVNCVTFIVRRVLNKKSKGEIYYEKKFTKNS